MSNERTSRGRRVGSATLTTLAVLATCPLVALTALFGIAALRDWQIQAVLSSSMYPAIKRGSLTIVVPEVPANIEPGIPIAYQDPSKPERVVVHRVVQVKHYGNRLFFHTKGDFNRAADMRPVPDRNLIGRVRWSVPHLGAAMNSLRSRAGSLFFVGLPGLLVIADVIARRRRSRSAADDAYSGTEAGMVIDERRYLWTETLDRPSARFLREPWDSPASAARR